MLNRMEAKELLQKQPDELRRMASELRAKLRDLRFKVATRQWSKVRTVRELKKDLAKVETVLNATSSNS